MLCSKCIKFQAGLEEWAAGDDPGPLRSLRDGQRPEDSGYVKVPSGNLLFFRHLYTAGDSSGIQTLETLSVCRRSRCNLPIAENGTHQCSDMQRPRGSTCQLHNILHRAYLSHPGKGSSYRLCISPYRVTNGRFYLVAHFPPPRRGTFFHGTPLRLLISQTEGVCIRIVPHVLQADYFPGSDALRQLPIIPLDPLSVFTYSESSVEDIQGWLQECDGQHSCITKGPKPLPTRVIEVNPETWKARLLEASGKTGKYLTLSHRWGQSQPIRTTRANVARHRSEIPRSGLPRTFKDAMRLAIALGVSYIWIDSLCIIQDDADDWNQEAVKMAQYYGNSYVTIAATVSENANGGLFQDVTCKEVKFAWSGSRGKIDANVRIRKLASHPQPDNMAKYPLLSRAWVFQERILSSRILHFTQDEIYWECTERTQCQCGLITQNTQILQKADWRPLPLSQRFSLIVSTRSQFNLLWMQAVIEYTSMGLTKGTDKLLALSGIALKMSKLKGGAEYMAGLWSDTIAEDMMWAAGQRQTAFPLGGERKDGQCLPPPVKEWRAPSWSWASVDAPVFYPLVKMSPQITQSDGSPPPKDEGAVARRFFPGQSTNYPRTFLCSIELPPRTEKDIATQFVIPSVRELSVTGDCWPGTVEPYSRNKEITITVDQSKRQMLSCGCEESRYFRCKTAVWEDSTNALITSKEPFEVLLLAFVEVREYECISNYYLVLRPTGKALGGILKYERLGLLKNVREVKEGKTLQNLINSATRAMSKPSDIRRTITIV